MRDPVTRYELVHKGTTRPGHLRSGELPIVISYGAGRHSWAMTVKAVTDRSWREVRRRVAMVIHVDVGAERPETTRHMHEVAIPFLHQHGWDMTIIRPVVRARDGRLYNNILEYYLAQAVLPTRANLSCSTRFKSTPCQHAIRDLVGEAVTAIGYHAGELQRPAKLSPKLLSQRCFPLIDHQLDHQACVEAAAASRLPLPIKSACHFCMNSKVAEMEDLTEVHPELMDLNIQLEENMHSQRGRTDITLLSRPMRSIRDRYLQRKAAEAIARVKGVPA